jgi:colanic acid/amylovoran biosynthesis glycosyltransferase
MKNHLRVLEIFGTYLPGTQNWVYSFLKYLPDTAVVIAAREFKKCNFYASHFTYLEFPLKMVETENSTLTVRAYNAFASKALRSLYHSYVTKCVGNIDVIHSHFAYVGWEYLNVAKKLKTPHVVSFYGYDYENIPFEHIEWKGRYEQLFRKADLFLCEGSFGAGVLQDLGCPKHKIAIQRLGVDVDSIPFLKREKKAGELNLVQIATMTGKKGHIYTIKAFIKALETCPNMSLTFVGRDEGVKNTIQTITRRSHVENLVTFLDWVDLNNLHAFMGGYHVFIHPSCHTAAKDCEGGAPIVLLDAQATGMPIISTTHCDIPSEVIHNQTGLLTPEKDVVSLANSIKYFYELNNSEYRTFCKNARKHVELNFNCKNNAAQLKEVYDTLA